MNHEQVAALLAAILVKNGGCLVVDKSSWLLVPPAFQFVVTPTPDEERVMVTLVEVPIE